jgi:hypothetical protein
MRVTSHIHFFTPNFKRDHIADIFNDVEKVMTAKLISQSEDVERIEEKR